MARVLIVGCGCRGRALATALRERGHSVRGTTRRRGEVERIEAAGAEPALADPSRLGTLVSALEGSSLACWLMARARGSDDAVKALHGSLLSALLDLVVDTHVRGFVYEAGGRLDASVASEGRAIVRRAGETFRMPVQVVESGSLNHDGWLEQMASAVEAALAA